MLMQAYTPQELMNYQSNIEKHLISQLKQQSPKKDQYTRLMNNYETCRQMHSNLEKAAPEPKPIEEKMLRPKTVRQIALVPVVTTQTQER